MFDKLVSFFFFYFKLLVTPNFQLLRQSAEFVSKLVQTLFIYLLIDVQPREFTLAISIPQRAAHLCDLFNDSRVGVMTYDSKAPKLSSEHDSRSANTFLCPWLVPRASTQSFDLVLVRRRSRPAVGWASTRSINEFQLPNGRAPWMTRNPNSLRGWVRLVLGEAGLPKWKCNVN